MISSNRSSGWLLLVANVYRRNSLDPLVSISFWGCAIRVRAVLIILFTPAQYERIFTKILLQMVGAGRCR